MGYKYAMLKMPAAVLLSPGHNKGKLKALAKKILKILVYLDNCCIFIPH
jgi:hypothetical protein